MRAWLGWIAVASIAFVLGDWAGRSAALRAPAPAKADARAAAPVAPLPFRVASGAGRVPGTRAAAPGAPLPEGTFAEVVAELTRRADAGDAAASLELAKRYWQCRGVPEHVVPPELEARAAKRADATRRWTTKRPPEERRAMPTPARGDVENLHLGRALGMLHYCGDTPRDVDRRRGLAALQRAAELGDADARLIYWSEAFDDAELADAEALVERKRVAADLLRDALRAGDWRALAAVADIVERGHFAPPDAQAAYAYWYAMQLAPGASGASLPWLTTSELLGGPDARGFAERRIAYLGPKLTPQQLADAERLGRELFAECCRG